MRLLLGFGNRARHGKDSAAQAIVDKFECSGSSIRIFKFAEELYKVCRTEYGMTEKDAPLLQRVGDQKRERDSRYWIDRLFFSIGSFDGIGLITDVRYRNEAEEIKRRGGFLVGVTRLNEDGTKFIAPDRDPRHPSETELDDCNWDARIVTKTGQEALAAEQAITIANYFYQISEPANV